MRSDRSSIPLINSDVNRPTFIERLEARRYMAVSFTETSTTVTLNNGLVSAVVQKSNGSVMDMRLGSGPNLMDPTRGLYWSIDATVAGVTKWSWMNAGQAPTVTVTKTADMVDVKLVNDKMNYDAATAPFGWFSAELHIVLRDGEKGLYTYHVLRHTADQPAVELNLDMHQLRANSMFTSSATQTAWSFAAGQKEGKSIGTMPAGTVDLLPEVQKLPVPNYYAAPTGQTAEGFPVYDQPIGNADDGLPTWSKYDWHTFEGTTTTSRTAFGDATDSYGIWFVQGSQEFYNGGPTKQKATVSGNLLYADFTNDHGLGSTGNDDGLAAGEVFEKVVGPVFVYANTGSGHQNLWADAQARGTAEVARFPNYPWLSTLGVTESMFPLQRGNVAGKLIVPGGSAANAQLILAEPGIDWQLQGYNNLLFWTRADANGNFNISEVRPGTYSMYVYTPGSAGENRVDNVTVAANGTTQLGNVYFNPAVKKQTLWSIGTPDRSTAEFKFGNRTRQYGLWWHYLADAGTGDLNYTPGVSDPAQNWYYAQMIIPTGLNTDTSGGYVGPKWNVNFNLTAAQISSFGSTPLTLTVNLAGSMGTAFYVDLNGSNVIGGSTGVYTTNDNALYRNAVQSGRYQPFTFTIAANKFVAGSNVLSFRLRAPGSAPNPGSTWTGTKPVIPTGGVMYDYIRLEAGVDAASGASAWTESDVGTVNTPIAAGVDSSNTLNQQTTSTGLGSTADNIAYAYQTRSGDGQITSRLLTLTGTGSASAGVMLRATTGNNAAFAAVEATQSGQVVFRWRSTTGAAAGSASVNVSGPVYLRVTRVGSTLAGYYSTNGSTWTQIGIGVAVTLPTAALAGVSSSSGSATVLSVATLTQPTISAVDAVAPTLLSASSQKTTGSSATISIPLALTGQPTVEPRQSGPTTLALNFSEVPVAVDGTLSANEFLLTNANFVSATLSGTQIVLRLSGIPDRNRVTVQMTGIADASGNTLGGVQSIAVNALLGDVDGNGTVSFSDFLVLQNTFGSAFGNAVYSSRADLDGNGNIDFTDFLLLQNSFGNSVIA